MPAAPHHAAGSLMLPPESLPRPSSDAPAPMREASPLDDPPGERRGSIGCTQRPCSGCCDPGWVLAITIAPAARNRATAVASRVGIRPVRRSDSPSHAMPATSIQSFTVSPVPTSGPTRSVSSRNAAAAIAAVSSRATTAPNPSAMSSRQSASRTRSLADIQDVVSQLREPANQL